MIFGMVYLLILVYSFFSFSFFFLNFGTTINPGAFVDAAEVGEKKQTQITD